MTYRVTLQRVIRSEWTKVRSLRSSWIVLGVAAFVTVGLAGAFGYGFGQRVRAGEVAATAAGAVDATFLGLDLFSLVVGVFAVWQLSGEYGSGLIRASLTAVPRRWPLIAAKAVVLVAVTVPLSLAVCLGSFLTCQLFAGTAATSIGDPGVLRAVLGAAAYPVASGLIGLGVGALVRNIAGSVTAFVAGYLFIPAILPAALPQRIQDDTLRYLPIAAGQAVYAISRDSGPVRLLSPAAGGLVLTAWVLAILACGTLVLLRRDA
jgi:ABC-type transport system involved in multi-copper enzyme maturation permease subunit